MKRRPSTQDISWFLDLNSSGKLNLDPPYQRRSVWTRKDRQFFLDTIFKDFPSPAIFLHKTMSDDGAATYNVVDGKQRLETILSFVGNKLRIPKNYGDVRLDGKRWKDLEGETEAKDTFWNYQITVEMLDRIEAGVVNEVFDRLNRNSRKLVSQELRHAKFDGWFINIVEAESIKEEWAELGVVTTGRAKRMADCQFISELLMILIEKKMVGFDQDGIDAFYGKYDEPEEETFEFSEDEFKNQLDIIKKYLLGVNNEIPVIDAYAKTVGNFLTLWAIVVIEFDDLPKPAEFAKKYKTFMKKVAHLSGLKKMESILDSKDAGKYKDAFTYLSNLVGAATDFGPREARYDSLKKNLIG